MKKQLFLTALAALALVSCSKENVLDTNKGNAIDFRAAMGTRAQETNTANINSIYVTALDARHE
ncbi:MAG: fimbrillin family protein, partial [Odoribacter splanchnicus]